MAASVIPWDQLLKASPLSQNTVQVALAQLGRGESGGNNRGPWVETYRMDKVAGPWCAAFVSWCYHKAWAALHGHKTITEAPRRLRRTCPLKWSSGARRATEGLERVLEPLPGDLVLWERGSKGGTAHLGLFLYHTLPNDGLFGTIEGNKGKYPSKVRVFTHEFGEGGLLGFYRVPYSGILKEFVKK